MGGSTHLRNIKEGDADSAPTRSLHLLIFLLVHCVAYVLDSCEDLILFSGESNFLDACVNSHAGKVIVFKINFDEFRYIWSLARVIFLRAVFVFLELLNGFLLDARFALEQHAAIDFGQKHILVLV